MSYYSYYMCEHCGASLDPGERCDCQDERKAEQDSTRSPQPEQSDDIERAIRPRYKITA